MGILLLIIIILAILLAIFSLFVATATIIVKKVWFSCRVRTPSKTIHVQRNRPSQKNSEFQSRNDGKTYSPTGWVWNDNTKLWEPPGYTQNDPAPIQKARSEPTFEEWKAAREAEKSKDESTT